MTSAEGTMAPEQAGVAGAVLVPRLYTTDFEVIDRIDVNAARDDLDAVLSDLRSDEGKQFDKDENWHVDPAAMPEELRKEFVDLLSSSLSAELSSGTLYAEIKKHLNNPDTRDLFALMSRDEARHASFISDVLRDLNVTIDPGIPAQEQRYSYFRPKFILYASYLSEKLGYVRYITIHRELERNPDRCFHPVFRSFEKWCHDEFNHGEALAVLLRAEPKLLGGLNKYWIRFFLVDVFATMFVRDHMRPEFFKALGVDTTEFDFEVFRKTTEITRQVFPITLDLEHPMFRSRIERLWHLAESSEAARGQGGIVSLVKRVGYGFARAWTWLRLYFLPVKPNELPQRVRLTPS